MESWVNQTVVGKLTMNLQWPANRQILDSVDSTNSYVKRQLATGEKVELPWLVVAREQTAGRGRNSKAWLSDQNSLCFTLVWQPSADSDVQMSDCLQLPLVVGLCVRHAVSSLLDPVAKVKWPNDVFIDGLKLAGVLIETIKANASPVIQGAAALPIFAIGIGINCDVDLQAQDFGVASRATSLRSHLRPGIHVNNLQLQEMVLALVLQSLRQALMDIGRAVQELQTNWQRHCFLQGRWIEIRSNSESIVGECLGIDERGALIIRDPGGSWHTVISGEVVRY